MDNTDVVCHKKTITDCQVCSYKLNYIALSKVHMDSAHSPGVAKYIKDSVEPTWILNSELKFYPFPQT